MASFIIFIPWTSSLQNVFCGWAVDFIIYQVEKFGCLRQVKGGQQEHSLRLMDCKSLIRLCSSVQELTITNNPYYLVYY